MPMHQQELPLNRGIEARRERQIAEKLQRENQAREKIKKAIFDSSNATAFEYFKGMVQKEMEIDLDEMSYDQARAMSVNLEKAFKAKGLVLEFRDDIRKIEVSNLSIMKTNDPHGGIAE